MHTSHFLYKSHFLSVYFLVTMWHLLFLLLFHALGVAHTLGVASDPIGTWGQNSDGQLGNTDPDVLHTSTSCHIHVVDVLRIK